MRWSWHGAPPHGAPHGATGAPAGTPYSPNTRDSTLKRSDALRLNRRVAMSVKFLLIVSASRVVSDFIRPYEEL